MLKRRIAGNTAAAFAVMQVAHAMRKPVTAVTAREVDSWANPTT